MSSLVYLGLSLVLFVITYGIAFSLMPVILGYFFTMVDDNTLNISAEWQTIATSNVTTIQYLVPLMPSFGILILVIKVLMTAAARGRD